MMKKWLVLFLLIVSRLVSFSQEEETKSLLDDMTIQFQCTEAVDSLYNGNFLVAEKQFGWLIEEHPEHPLGYFLMGLSQWWKILPNDEVKKYDAKFYNYLDLTIEKGKKLYKKDKKNPEASFFLALAYGLKGRRIADNGSRLRAIHPADKASDYLTKNLELGEDFGPEFLLGHGLYNFFREWLAIDEPGLKPILAPFKKGDMKKGLDQLERCASESFYSRVEAKVFLMDIYGSYGVYKKGDKIRKGDKADRSYTKAYEIASSLSRTYPSNKYFERRKAELSFYMNKDVKKSGAKLAAKILRIERNYPGTYGKRAVRNLSYFLANYYTETEGANGLSPEKSIIHYEKAADLAEELGVESLGFTMNSYVRLAAYYEAQEDKVKAVKYYELFLDNYSSSSKEHGKDVKKKAKEYVKENGEKKFLGIF